MSETGTRKLKPIGPSKVLIIDDHPIVRAGLSKILEDEPDLVVCGEAQDAPSALTAIERTEPQIALLDISLPGRNGLELLKDLRIRHPDLKILIISAHDESVYGERALRAGARGYLNKAQANDVVVLAIRRVLKGGIYASEQVTSQLLSQIVRPSAPRVGVSALTDRELDVFQLLGRGRGTRQIAATLHLSIKTIETYRSRIKKKLKVTTSGELVKRAVEWGTKVSPSEPSPLFGPDPHGRPACFPPRGERFWLVSPVLPEPVRLEEGGKCTIGRTAQAKIRLQSSRVSRVHAVLRWRDGGLEVADLQSTNGTLLNGHLLREPCFLHPSDRIRIAAFELVVRIGDAAPDPGDDTVAIGADGFRANA